MTSNLGAKQLQTNATLGFRAMGDTDAARAETSYEIMKEKVQAELKQNFRPEFLNRIDCDGRLPLPDRGRDPRRSST